LAHVVTQLPKPSLEYKEFRIQGSKATLIEAVNKTRPGITIEYVDSLPEEVSYLEFYQVAANSGIASTGWDVKANKEILEGAGRDNKLWEGHVWKTL
jgi:hypothetical protein